ncbi:hypothetical protein ABT160_41765 [Streptomyces sp. NPDC001941]|uniref:hypothetical protein n=1 Tax=Streptomyces sp. NPDC001941 TaxID=3154659 RepID=UPI0033300309
MSEIEALLDALRRLPARPPAGPGGVHDLLDAAKSAAARWADVLDEIGSCAHGLVGPRAEAALAAAFRRAEQSYVELEIALADFTEFADPGTLPDFTDKTGKSDGGAYPR